MGMGVPYYDHGKMIRRQRAGIEAALARVLDRGVPDWGPEVPAFEVELAAWTGAAHAVTTISGTVAIQIALRTLGVGAGDEVITVANTDSATPSAVRLVGARPVFVDIEPGSRTLDAAQIEAAMTPRTRAILPVDLHGHPADMPAITEIARARGIAVVEDAAIALGASIGGRMVGTLADVTCVSFGAGKLLGTVGTGGACLTDDPALAHRMRLLSGYGQDKRRPENDRPYESMGMNARLPELQAAILRMRLPLLANWLDIRTRQARAYDAGFAGLAAVQCPSVRHGVRHAWRNYVIEIPDRDRVRERLASIGIETQILYAPPIYREPGFADLGYGPGALPVTERVAQRLLCLPIGPHLDLAQIAQVIAAVTDCLG